MTETHINFDAQIAAIHLCSILPKLTFRPREHSKFDNTSPETTSDSMVRLAMSNQARDEPSKPAPKQSADAARKTMHKRAGRA